MMKFALGLLSLLMVYFFSTIETAATDSWEEDFRRCRVLKPFSQGSVIISAGEEMVELDVQWKDGADLNNLGVANISVQIDDVPLPHPQPLKSDTGVIYGYSLGSFNATPDPDGARWRERLMDWGVQAWVIFHGRG
jgi:hypothetical protein